MRGPLSMSMSMSRLVFMGAEMIGTSADGVTVTSMWYTTTPLRVVSSHGRDDEGDAELVEERG